MNVRSFCPILAILPLLTATPALSAEKRYAIPDFEKVQIFGPFNVVIQPGRATSVTASGEVQALELLSVVSNGGILTIQKLVQARSSWKDRPAATPKIIITLPQLKAVRLLGTGTVAVAEMKGIETSVTLNGGGQLSVAKLASDTANVSLNGSGRLILAGAAKNFRANLVGSGDMDASMLNATDLKIVSATSGRISARASRTADVKQTGAGDMRIAGSPSCLVENSGAGTVACGD